MVDRACILSTLEMISHIFCTILVFGNGIISSRRLHMTQPSGRLVMKSRSQGHRSFASNPLHLDHFKARTSGPPHEVAQNGCQQANLGDTRSELALVHKEVAVFICFKGVLAGVLSGQDRTSGCRIMPSPFQAIWIGLPPDSEEGGPRSSAAVLVKQASRALPFIFLGEGLQSGMDFTIPHQVAR